MIHGFDNDRLQESDIVYAEREKHGQLPLHAFVFAENRAGRKTRHRANSYCVEFFAHHETHPERAAYVFQRAWIHQGKHIQEDIKKLAKKQARRRARNAKKAAENDKGEEWKKADDAPQPKQKRKH